MGTCSLNANEGMKVEVDYIIYAEPVHNTIAAVSMQCIGKCIDSV